MSKTQKIHVLWKDRLTRQLYIEKFDDFTVALLASKELMQDGKAEFALIK